MIISGIVLVLFLLATGVTIAVLYKVPTCADKIQNQDEVGVDCGGTSCTYLCVSQVSEPFTVYARPLTRADGRVDVVASIQNTNRSAEARNVAYTLELFGADGTLVKAIAGTIDLPAGKTVPLFVRGATYGAVITTAFVSFTPETIAWVTSEATYPLPRVTEATRVEGATPRITATLVNETFDPLYNTRAIAVVRSGDGTIIGASETVVPFIASQASLPVTFTWSEPFIEQDYRFEIIPTGPLP